MRSLIAVHSPVVYQVRDIVDFYQSSGLGDPSRQAAPGGEVWDKMKGAAGDYDSPSPSPSPSPQPPKSAASSIVAGGQDRYANPRAPPAPPGAGMMRKQSSASTATSLAGSSASAFQPGRPAPPPPSRSYTTSEETAPRPAPAPPRAAPGPGTAAQPVLDRSMSARAAPSSQSQQQRPYEIDRSKSQRAPPAPPGGGGASQVKPARPPASSRSQSNGPPAPGSAHAALQKQASRAKEQQQQLAAPSSSGTATPRRRVTQDKAKDNADVVARLMAICTDADPTKLYRNLVKIGQGASGGVYTAYQVGTNHSVAIKQMNLEKQPKQDLIINEILVMKSSHHPKCDSRSATRRDLRIHGSC
jgi:p21-activated kinase 1